jgi:DNA-binding MarR family transcriptional regulator
LLKLAVGADRRSREVSTTPAGRRLLARADDCWKDAQRAFERKFGREEAATLRGMLHRVAATEFSLASERG